MNAMTHSQLLPKGDLMSQLDELEALITASDFPERLRTLQMSAWRIGDTTLIRTCARARSESRSVHSPNVLACAMLLRRLPTRGT
jgi:hypothetical protein